MMKYLIPAIMLSFVPIGPAGADCARPKPPFCATAYNRVDTQLETERCKREMDDYRRATENFLACQKRDARQAQDEYNATVRFFDRRTRGY